MAYLIVIAVLALWWCAVRANRSRLHRYDGSGDAAKGIVIFVEPLHWLFIVWGFAPFCRGLRRAGGEHHIRLFRWGGRAGALLVIPDFVRRNRLLRKSERLARFILDVTEQHPGRTIHVVAYSTGCFIAAEALKRIERTVPIGEVVLLAGALSPGYDVVPLLSRVQRIHCFHSRLDFVISGLGPLLLGSNDGRFTPACGMVGLRAAPELVTRHGWTPNAIRTGYLGDHFTITSSAFVAKQIAPILGSTNADV